MIHEKSHRAPPNGAIILSRTTIARVVMRLARDGGQVDSHVNGAKVRTMSKKTGSDGQESTATWANGGMTANQTHAELPRAGNFTNTVFPSQFRSTFL